MTLQEQVDRLRAEIELLHAQIAANEWKHMRDRFHGFDAIKDDACPCCGGRVAVTETGEPFGVRLAAVR
jgi:hypothetical protein